LVEEVRALRETLAIPADVVIQVCLLQARR
jgi:hypothetical protein